LKKSKAHRFSNAPTGNISGKLLMHFILKIECFRELPAPIRPEVRGIILVFHMFNTAFNLGIADTSNFDDFGDCGMIIRKLTFQFLFTHLKF
jgi:hypothetical protein